MIVGTAATPLAVTAILVVSQYVASRRVALLLVVPLLAVTGFMAARGGYASGSFWRSTRDEKLDRRVSNGSSAEEFQQ